MGTGQIGLHTCCPTYTDLCETTLCKDVSNPNKVTIGDSRRGGRLSLKLNWMSARHDCPIMSNDLKLARVVNAIAYYRYYQSSIHAAVPEVRKGAFGTVILIVYHDIVARLYIILVTPDSFTAPSYPPLPNDAPFSFSQPRDQTQCPADNPTI